MSIFHRFKYQYLLWYVGTGMLSQTLVLQKKSSPKITVICVFFLKFFLFDQDLVNNYIFQVKIDKFVLICWLSIDFVFIGHCSYKLCLLI